MQQYQSMMMMPIQQQPQQFNPAKYKTSICRHFMQNKICQLGSRCQFAHGDHELRQVNDPLPNNANIINPTVFKNPSSGNFKSMVCKYFMNGFCKNQTNCTFAHGELELQGGYVQPNDYQYKLKIQAMHSIIYSLQTQVLFNDPISVQKLQIAQQAIIQNDTQKASNLEIMQDPRRTQHELTLYNEIFGNAQKQLKQMNSNIYQ